MGAHAADPQPLHQEINAGTANATSSPSITEAAVHGKVFDLVTQDPLPNARAVLAKR